MVYVAEMEKVEGELVRKENALLVNFPLLSMEELFDKMGFNEEAKELMYKLVDIMKRCHAAKRHHGAYEGGLFDHTYLICCYADYLADSINTDINKRFLLRACFFHDLGKIIIHPNNMKEEMEKLYRPVQERIDLLHLSIVLERNTGYSIAPALIGENTYEHTLKSISIIHNLGLREHPEVIKAIMFHHGGWSDFKRGTRVDSTPLSAILHAADLLVSQVLKI